MTAAASTGTVIAMAVGGTIAVLAVCAVFYAIGRGEDRDRASALAAEAPPEPAPPAADDAAPPASTPPRPRSPRSAQRRRRP